MKISKKKDKTKDFSDFHAATLTRLEGLCCDFRCCFYRVSNGDEDEISKTHFTELALFLSDSVDSEQCVYEKLNGKKSKNARRTPWSGHRRYYDVKMKLNANFVFMEISYLDFFFCWNI